MSTATRVAPEFIWPKTLRLPPRPPKLVYLDLLHWVSLAKANTGHRDRRRYADVLGACVTAVESRDAVFPISDATYMEVSKIGQHRQRRDLRDVIELVSQYRVITSRGRTRPADPSALGNCPCRSGWFGHLGQGRRRQAIGRDR